jgi:hypothetical protein
MCAKVNYWVPLGDLSIIRPLIVMDIKSLSSSNVYHVTNGNDMMLVSFNESQRIYFKPRMLFGEAAAFLSGITPHSSASLPGEACLLKNRSDCGPVVDADIQFLQSNVSSAEWRRRSIEMRCLVIVVPETGLLVLIAFLALLCIFKLGKQ